MSNSIITGYAVVGLETKIDGKYVYLLYKEGFEKNVYPHVPTWSIVFIGNYVDCIRTLVRWAACCEGGMSENKSGRTITPPEYLTEWRKAFRNVARRHDSTFTFSFGNAFRQVSVEFQTHFTKVFNKNGCPLEPVPDHTLDLNNSNVLSAVLELFGPHKLSIPHPGSYWPLTYSLYEVLEGTKTDPRLDVYMPDACVNYANVACYLFDTLDIEVFSIGSNQESVSLIIHGEHFAAGHRYRVLNRFLEAFAPDYEVNRSGSFNDLYKQLKEKIDNAQPAPSGSYFKVQKPDVTQSQWVKNDWDECVQNSELTIDQDTIGILTSRWDDVYAMQRNDAWLTKLEINRDNYKRMATSANQMTLIS